LLRAIAAQGPAPRAEAREIVGLPERTSRRLVADLLDEGLLRAENNRAPLRIAFPAHAAPYLFPDIFPAADF
jgi:hypothetical protein